MNLNIFQKMMYVVLSITLACAVATANYIYLPVGERVAETSNASEFLERYNDSNDRILKALFPYEEQEYRLAVPSNMTYTTADFQQFDGTYLTKKDKVSTDYLKKICFCGDSITYHMGDGRILKNYDVVAYPGLSVLSYATYSENPVYNKSQISNRTTITWLSQLKPEIIYLMLGTNGIVSMPNENHIESYRKLLDKIATASPYSIIVICSMSPYGFQYKQTEINVLNYKIDHFNMLLLELAKERGYYFLNVAEVLKGDDGALPESYNVGDGYHWNDTARDIYLDYVLTHPVIGY